MKVISYSPDNVREKRRLSDGRVNLDLIGDVLGKGSSGVYTNSNNS